MSEQRDAASPVEQAELELELYGRFVEILSPAINVRAPYAKQMIAALVAVSMPQPCPQCAEKDAKIAEFISRSMRYIEEVVTARRERDIRHQKQLQAEAQCAEKDALLKALAPDLTRDDCSLGVFAARMIRDGFSYDAKDGIWWHKTSKPGVLEQAEAQCAALRDALTVLVIDANHLTDRCMGGTYEADCRRSVEKARAALAQSQPERQEAK